MNFDLSILGVKKNIPKVNFIDYCGLVCGIPKFGKTTMASLYPNSIVAPFEEGYKATVSNVLDELNEWEDFIDFVDKLENNRDAIGDSVKTIVFDTVNKAYEFCEPYTLKQLGRLDGKKYSKPSDVPHGQFYPARDKYFAEQVDRILKLGFMPLFITHSQVKTITPKEGESYDVYSSTMPDRLEKIIYPLVDYIIYGERTLVDDGLGNKIPKRILKVKSNSTVTAGNRVYLDDDIIFDTEEEAMEKFQQAFKASIQKTLEKAGITDDIEKLSEQQDREKQEKVKKYIEEQKSPSNEELCKVILDGFGKVSGDKQKEVSEKLKEFNISSFKEPEKLDKEKLLKLVELLQ